MVEYPVKEESTVRVGWALVLSAVTLLGACGTTDSTSSPTRSATSPTVPTSPSATTATHATTTPPPPSKARNWFELEVGDCLTALPQIDLGVVTVNVVDCATPHAAEVFLHAPLKVNTAVADVANQQCVTAFSHYTGQSPGGAFAVTYLIDSNQDRTSNNPYPSAVICLLQAADGGTLARSARK